MENLPIENSCIRQKFVDEAKTWLGTKFKHQGRLKHIGCDCIGLISGCMNNLNLKINGREIKEIDLKNYSRIPDGKILENNLDSLFTYKNIKDVEIGDIFLMRFFKNPQHVGIISEISDNNDNSKNIKIIHSYQNSHGVVEHILSEGFRDKIIKIYDFESTISVN